MNKRQKKKRIKIENKKLIKEYPFLLPRNVWTDKPIKNYDYTYTLLDDMPDGWKKAFGKLICEDIKNILMKNECLEDYKIDQIKEKYSELRWYCNGGNEIQDIIRKYEYISRHVCVVCGKVNVPVFDGGWMCPYCYPCYKNICNIRKSKFGINTDIEKYKVDDAMLCPTFKIKRFSKEKDETITIDCSDVLIRMGVDISTLPTEKEVEEHYKSKKNSL